MKRIQWKSFLMICFILVVIVIALMFHRNIMQQDNKLDTWLGGFKYEEIVPHPSGELNYYTDYYWIFHLFTFYIGFQDGLSVECVQHRGHIDYGRVYLSL